MDTDTGATDLLAVVEWALRIIGNALLTGALVAGIVALVGVLAPLPLLVAAAPLAGLAAIGITLTVRAT